MELTSSSSSLPKVGINFASTDSTNAAVKFNDEEPNADKSLKLTKVSPGWNVVKGAVLKSGLRQISKYADNDEPPLTMPYIPGSMIGLKDETNLRRKFPSMDRKPQSKALGAGKRKPTENKTKGFSNGRLLVKRKSVNRGYTFRLAKGQSYKAVQYIDLETGKTFLTTTEKFLDPSQYRRVEGCDIEAPAACFDPAHPSVDKFKTSGRGVNDLQFYNEIDTLGHVWRRALRSLISLTTNEVNALRFTRGLQIADGLSKVLAIAFSCRNVSRIMVQQIQRFDILWHQNTQFKWNRWFDCFGNIPFFGATGFPATENFPDIRRYAIASVFRRILGAGHWQTRLITGRQALQTACDVTVISGHIPDSRLTIKMSLHKIWQLKPVGLSWRIVANLALTWVEKRRMISANHKDYPLMNPLSAPSTPCL